jgi:hypothetical protein
MTTAADTIKAIQESLHEAPDGAFGPRCRAALELLLSLAPSAPWPPEAPAPAADGTHKVKASTFADPADVSSFRRCKAQGGTDLQCFKKGDNGTGFTGLDCTRTDKAFVALPPEFWKPRFGSAQAAAGKPVIVTLNGRTATCILGDTMPHLANITNGCGIDLAPGAQLALGIKPGTYEGAVWKWG